MSKNITSKLFAVQQEIGKISKDTKNPFYNSKYFDINKLIEHCTPIFQKHKVLLLQPIRDGIVCTIIRCEETQEEETSCIALPPIPDPQKIGAAITYYRRYSLISLLGLQAEDDDGNSAIPKRPSANKSKPITANDNFLSNG